MTRQETIAELKGRGITFDGRWNDEKLASLLPTKAPEYTEEQISNIADHLKSQGVQPVENVFKNVHRYDDGSYRTKSGIYIPDNTLKGYSKTKWNYHVRHGEELSVVTRKMYTGLEESVRTYSKADHGEHFKKLAEQFVTKNNK